jgi:hypothetical protein
MEEMHPTIVITSGFYFSNLYDFYAVVGVRIETIFHHQALHQQPEVRKTNSLC